MAFNGSGVFNRIHNWVQDAANAINITASRMDAEMDGLATGLSTCITKDGQTTVTANLGMATFRHTNVGVAAARTDYARASQVQDGALTYLTSVSGTDTITASSTFSPGAYAAGQQFHFVSAGANTGAATLNVNGLGAKAVTKNGTTALAAGDIPSGAAVIVLYDGTRFQLAQNVFDSSTLGTASTVDTGTSTGNVPLVSDIHGQQQEFIPASAMKPTITNGCAPLIGHETTSGRPDIETLDFDQTSAEFAQFYHMIPKRWNLAPVQMTPVWTHLAATTFGVAWTFEAVSLDDGDSLDSAYGSTATVIDTGGTSEDVYIGGAGVVTPAGTATDFELQVFRVGRNPASGSDTLDADAKLIGVLLSWTSSALNDS